MKLFFPKELIYTPLFLLLGLFSCITHMQTGFKPKELYHSENLIISQISENVFVHISYIQTQDFGNVACNGALFKNGADLIVFDTPTNDQGANELINWIKNVLHCNIKSVVATHFHEDCLGGLQAFHNHGIPSYAYSKTIVLAKENKSIIPQNELLSEDIMLLGQEEIIIKYFGEGHTQDNIVAYYPKEGILFGGCLIKAKGASKGYLGDANVDAWSATVSKIKESYPTLNIVIPGHGAYGDTSLLNYTIQLFLPKLKK